MTNQLSMQPEVGKSAPMVLGVLMCERVLQDVLRRDFITCINIHNGMSVQGFPAIVPLIFAFAQVAGSADVFEYQFRMMDRNNEVVAMSPVARVDPLPNSSMTNKVISAFSGLVFNHEGIYNVFLSVNGNDVASLPFQVIKVDGDTA